MKVHVFEDNKGIETRGTTSSFRAWRAFTAKAETPMYPNFSNDNVCRICGGWLSNINLVDYGKVICICEIEKIEKRLKYTHGRFSSKTSRKNTLDDLQLWGHDLKFKEKLAEAIQGVTDWLEWPEKWLVLGGSVGTGKTHILLSIQRELEPWALYITASDLEGMIFESMQRTSDFALEELVNAAKYAPFLLLDDIGTEYGSDFPRAILRRIIDFRYQRPTEYVTVIASNKIKGYDPRITDRILDKHIGQTFILATDKSWRQHGNPK